MRTTVLGIIGSFIIMPVYGQHFVKGKIIDSENAVMPMVNVAFLNQSDSTLVTGAVSDSCGIYSTSLDGGSYIIRYSYLGYETLVVGTSGIPQRSRKSFNAFCTSVSHPEF